MEEIRSIGPLKGKSNIESKISQKVDSNKELPSFKETLGKFLNDVNKLQRKADESIEKMAAGEINDVHQVMNAVEQANVAFNMMMEIRNKVMDAYQEIMRLRL